MRNFVATLVMGCRRWAVGVVLCFIVLTMGAVGFINGHFRMNTDVDGLLAADLPWRQQEKILAKAFPQRDDLLVIVVDGQNAAAAEDAAARLTEKLTQRPDLFRNVNRPDALPFFRQQGLLYLEQAELADVIDRLMQAQPLLGSLAADQSLRGLFGTFGLMLKGIETKAVSPEQFAPIFQKISTIARAQHAGKIEPLDWQTLLNPAHESRQLRRFILTQPTLDYSALSPGHAATTAVRAMIQDLALPQTVTLRLTGSVALNDEEFGSIADSMGWAGLASMLLVALLLGLALRSVRLVMPILLTLLVGLILTTAFGLALFGALNLISVAFAVMFIGIAVDFGIQFGVRFRDQHFLNPDRDAALQETAKIIARPLVLAALATALGFFAFTPTAYAGVAELGAIAGGGMIIALVCNLTLLPALLTLFRPPAEAEAVGFAWLRPMDDALVRNRRLVLMASLGLALVGAAVASQLRFDFDPLNLKDPKAESVATMFDLAKNLDTTPYTAQLLAKDLASADALAEVLRALPEVARVMSLSSFVPADQDVKLPLLNDARLMLLATLTPTDFASPPRGEDLVKATGDLIAALKAQQQIHPAIAELAEVLTPLQNDQAALFQLQESLIAGLPKQLLQIRDLLGAAPVTVAELPEALQRDWMTADGRARLEIYPKLPPREGDNLLRFNRAVQNVAPEVTGTTIAIVESGRTVVNAFIQAALFAIILIALLVFLTLRKVFDTLALMSPLVLAGILTLASCVVLQIPVNFANIIGLPLLLGLGVSFAIYFVTYWRDGGTAPLQSSMARAVVFSAATTLVAFGSLALSTHPGTASMGWILTIALVLTLLCNCFLLPALLSQDK
jgi:uncharacterized protein